MRRFFYVLLISIMCCTGTSAKEKITIEPITLEYEIIGGKLTIPLTEENMNDLISLCDSYKKLSNNDKLSLSKDCKLLVNVNKKFVEYSDRKIPENRDYDFYLSVLNDYYNYMTEEISATTNSADMMFRNIEISSMVSDMHMSSSTDKRIDSLIEYAKCLRDLNYECDKDNMKKKEEILNQANEIYNSLNKIQLGASK